MTWLCVFIVNPICECPSRSITTRGEAILELEEERGPEHIQESQGQTQRVVETKDPGNVAGLSVHAVITGGVSGVTQTLVASRRMRHDREAAVRKSHAAWFDTQGNTPIATRPSAWATGTGYANSRQMSTVQVRYIVTDVDAAIAFYRRHLDFREEMHPAPSFAMLSRGDLRLVLSQPGPGGGGQAMPDGRLPEPGGWNRFTIEVNDLEATVAKLREAGVRFRNDIVTGVGGKQVLIDDPSGNPVELFEPILREARLSSRT
jgi:catechol 2,3-dioxygenase-like lactoylglutathione lyase family enzyme